MYNPSNASWIPWGFIRKLIKYFSIDSIQVISGENIRDLVKRKIPDISVTAHNFLPQSEYKQILDNGMFALIPERRGSFELPPIEHLSSGVPIFTPLAASIEVANQVLLEGGFTQKPFLDILSQETLDCTRSEIVSWYEGIDNAREDFAHLVKEAFSIYNVQKKFYEEITHLLSEDGDGIV